MFCSNENWGLKWAGIKAVILIPQDMESAYVDDFVLAYATEMSLEPKNGAEAYYGNEVHNIFPVMQVAPALWGDQDRLTELHHTIWKQRKTCM